MQDFGAFRRIDAIERIVARHYARRLLHTKRDLEHAEIDFTQGAFGNDAVTAFAGSFGIVAKQVLIGAERACLFQSLCVIACHDACQQRILGEIFRMPPAKDVAMNVHRRTEVDGNPVLLGFLADHTPDLTGQFFIEACGDRATRGEADVRLYDIQTGVAVGYAKRRQSVLSHLRRSARSPFAPRHIPIRTGADVQLAEFAYAEPRDESIQQSGILFQFREGDPFLSFSADRYRCKDFSLGGNGNPFCKRHDARIRVHRRIGLAHAMKVLYRTCDGRNGFQCFRFRYRERSDLLYVCKTVAEPKGISARFKNVRTAVFVVRGKAHGVRR